MKTNLINKLADNKLVTIPHNGLVLNNWLIVMASFVSSQYNRDYTELFGGEEIRECKNITRDFDTFKGGAADNHLSEPRLVGPLGDY